MIQLERGEKRTLAELTGSTRLDDLQVTLRHDLQGADVSVFGLDPDRKLQDDRYFVFYNQLSSPGGEVTLTQQPGSTQQLGGGTFRLNLSRLPAGVRRLMFVVTHDSRPFSGLGRLEWTLGDPETKVGLELRGDQFGSERAVMVAEVYERSGEWRVANVGQGFSGGLDALLINFGGQASEPAPTPPPAPPVSAPPGPSDRFVPPATPRPLVGPPTNRPGPSPAADGTYSLSQFLTKTAEADRPGDAFELENDKMLEVKVGGPGGTQGRVWSKLGAMVAYSGNLSFKREGMLDGGIMKALVRAVSSEMEPLAKIEGQGVAYLADQAKEITILKLQGDAINVAGHALLAFEDTVEHKIAMHRSVAGMVSGGLFSVLLRGQGMLALLSHGRPLTLRVTGGETVYTDPNATIGWSEHLTPQLRVDSSLKSIFGRGGGETFQMAFQGEGFVVVQPYEESMH
ncbi:AIM24 family protein [Deinococcus altitudinis]|uniref:AIM24 family protein n=1 Tax=Deinococcus altitudinis TaxID=468914 RepID=UPI00389169CC